MKAQAYAAEGKMVFRPGAQLLEHMAETPLISAWSSAGLVLESLLGDMARGWWAGRVPWFWGHTIPGVEAGRAASPAASPGGVVHTAASTGHSHWREARAECGAAHSAVR